MSGRCSWCICKLKMCRGSNIKGWGCLLKECIGGCTSQVGLVTLAFKILHVQFSLLSTSVISNVGTQTFVNTKLCVDRIEIEN